MTDDKNLVLDAHDSFLGGKISLFQPKDGYRANIDSILLAASVNANDGQRVLELGCGVGTVLFSLMSRVVGLKAIGVELQQRYARLAIRNGIYNGFEADIVECDISNLPSFYKNLHYDHVVFNPPYFNSKNSKESYNADKDLARREINFSLDNWIDIAIQRCSVKGEVVMIHQVDRLSQIIKCIDNRLGDVNILPIASFNGEHAKRILIRGKKGSSSPLKLLAPLIIHKGTRSDKLKQNYTDKVEGILRGGNALNWV